MDRGGKSARRGARVERELPTFSVVVPTHDRPPLVDEAVRSVLEQRRVSLECVVVDDGGREPLPAWTDPRVRIVRHDRPRGPGAARNTGIAAARGQYVAFLDDDDRYEPTRLATVEPYLSETVAVVCWSRALDRPAHPGRLLFGDESHTILDASTPQIGTVALSRLRCPQFDEALLLNQDVEWWLRVAQAFDLFTVPYPLHRFRIHTGPRVTDRAGERIRFSQVLMDKHATYFAAHPRARAFRQRRMGLIALADGRPAEGIRHLVSSFRSSPSPKAALHVARGLALASRGVAGGFRRRRPTEGGDPLPSADGPRHVEYPSRAAK